MFSVYYTDRTDRSLKLAWPSAIRPIVAVEHLLKRPLRLRSRFAYQGRSSRPRLFAAAALRLVFGTDHCIKMQCPLPKTAAQQLRWARLKCGRGFMIIATITRQGSYEDKKDICELYISKDSSGRLPHEHRKKKPICINIRNNDIRSRRT